MKRALSISEAAEYACVSRGTVYNWINNEVLPHESLPGRNGKPVKRIRSCDLEKFLNDNYKRKILLKSSTKKLLILPKNQEEYA